MENFYYGPNGDKIREEFGIPSERVATGVTTGNSDRVPEGVYWNHKDGERSGYAVGNPDRLPQGVYWNHEEGERPGYAVGNPDRLPQGVYWNHEEGEKQYYHGPMIDGAKPGDLILAGKLTPESISPEDKKVVYDDILLGLTDNKDLLAKKLDLIISDSTLVNSLLSIQYHLAVKEMVSEKRGAQRDISYRDRKFQFLATTKMLMEKGYDIDSLKFKRGEYEYIDLPKLLAEFRKECNKNDAETIIGDPSWFKSGMPPEGYDKRKTKSPWLFAGALIREIYDKDSKYFEQEYEKYKATSKRPPEEQYSFKEFMYVAYAIDVPPKVDALQQFMDEKEAQMAQDAVARNEQLAPIAQQLNNSNEGPTLK